MIIESTEKLKIGSVIQLADYEFTSNPTIPAKVIRVATFKEYVDDTLPDCSEEEKWMYQKQIFGTFHYEVSVD